MREGVNVMDRYIGVVISNEYINDRYYSIRVKCPEIALTIKEGQFVMIICGDSNDPLLRRPFSVYRYYPDLGEVEFAYLLKGKGTEIIKKLKPNDKIDLLGPLGNYYEIQPDTKGIAVLGRGVGIASIASLGEKAKKDGLYSLAILSGRTPEGIIGIDYLKEAGCDVICLYDSDKSSSIDNLEKILRNSIESGKITQIYSCGSNRMGKLVKELSEEFKLESYISFEEVMACGIGVCKGCVCETKNGYKTVCKDGPVFNVKEVEL